MVSCAVPLRQPMPTRNTLGVRRSVSANGSFVQEMTGVGNVCERAAMRGAEKLLVKKTAVDGVTVAVAAEHWEVTFG